jgi:hypothetical protein
MFNDSHKGERAGTQVEDTSMPVPPVRTFVVQRYPHPRLDRICNEAPLVEEGIEAHRFMHTANGDLIFERYVSVTRTPQGVIGDSRTVKVIAAGTYYDAREVTDVFTQSVATN